MMLFWVSMLLNLVRKYSVNCLPNTYFFLILNQQNLDFFQDGNPPLKILAIPAPLQTQVTTTLFWPMSCRQKSTESFWKIFSFLIKKERVGTMVPLPCFFFFFFFFFLSLKAWYIEFWPQLCDYEVASIKMKANTHTHTHTNSWIERKGKVCIL